MRKLGVFFLILVLTKDIFAQDLNYNIVFHRKDEVIWGFDFLGDGRIIFSERSGSLVLFNPQRKGFFKLKNSPTVWNKGQGGMLDVRVHPTKKDLIYFTYSKPTSKGGATTLAVARVEGNELKDVRDLLVTKSDSDNSIHFGSRIEFDGKGNLFFTVGDRNEREQVQNLAYHTGKVLRLTEDGKVPEDNPFVGKEKALPEIWAVGIRSPQGLNINPSTEELFEAEMGPRGGDEINIIRKGLNYGWPVVTYGREYWGPKIGEGTTKAGMESPLHYWVPSISPSAIHFYNGNLFPQWKGKLLVATLSGMHLRLLTVDKNKVTSEIKLLEDKKERFRNVRSGTDGSVYVSTDSGKLIRLSPK